MPAKRFVAVAAAAAIGLSLPLTMTPSGLIRVNDACADQPMDSCVLMDPAWGCLVDGFPIIVGYCRVGNEGCGKG